MCCDARDAIFHLLDKKDSEIDGFSLGYILSSCREHLEYELLDWAKKERL